MRGRRGWGSALAMLLVVACGAPRAAPAPALVRTKRLAAPAPPDKAVLGAAYLTTLASHVQPGWGQFLEDCRLRLASTDPLNAPSLVATAHLAIGRRGDVVVEGVTSSGNRDFDDAVEDLLAEARVVEPPPAALWSDDDLVHLTWIFARDARQAGPATARIEIRRGALAEVVPRFLAHDQLVRAARRIATSASDEPGRADATQRVLVAALREGLAGLAGSRAFAIEAIGRAQVTELAAPLRELVTRTSDTELRLVATNALAALGDTRAVEQLAALLPNDLRNYPRLALADTAALVALGARDRAAQIVRTALAPAAVAAVLPAHALAPTPALDATFAQWFTRGDARTRAGVCAAQPAGASRAAQTLIGRGLRDADASVRATCVDAAARQRDRNEPRLRELARDRDRTVRARAIAALSTTRPRAMDLARIVQAATDAAPEVRAAAAHGAPVPTLHALVADPDPDVRAAAIVALGDPEASARAATDVAPQVRRAAIGALTDDDLLGRLTTDDAPEVATAALVRLVARRGRDALTTELLVRLAAAPPGSAERIRIALAWLLGH